MEAGEQPKALRCQRCGGRFESIRATPHTPGNAGSGETGRREKNEDAGYHVPGGTEALCDVD